MWCELFLDMNGDRWYGPIPEYDDPTGYIEFYDVDQKLHDILLEQFAYPINEVCDTCLDDGDVDFFDKEQCVKLAAWLEGQLAGELNPRLREPYVKLLEFARRAIELGTGVAVEMKPWERERT